MNICFICCEYPPALHGGIGAVIQTTARALVQRGHAVRVVGIYPRRETAPPYEEDQGVRVWRIRMPRQRLGWILARYRLFKTVRSWVVRNEIDIVEVPDWEGHTSLWPRINAPIIVRLHGSLAYFAVEMNQRVRPGAFWLESRSFHRAYECSSCSQYTATRTSEIFGPRSTHTTVLYNSVALSQAAETIERQQNRVVFAGTLTKKKGIIQLIKAWPRVRSTNPDAELHVYGKDAGLGDGSALIPHLKSLLNEEIRDSVHFHGHVAVSQLRSLYQSCSLAVFPSYAEAFAVAPLEAMAEGCPVICSNRSSGPELIEPGTNGLLIDPDDEAQISESILSLLNDRCLAHRLGVAGKRTIEERFSSDHVVRQFVDFYTACVHRFRQNGSAKSVPQQA